MRARLYFDFINKIGAAIGGKLMNQIGQSFDGTVESLRKIKNTLSESPDV